MIYATYHYEFCLYLGKRRTNDYVSFFRLEMMGVRYGRGPQVVYKYERNSSKRRQRLEYR